MMSSYVPEPITTKDIEIAESGLKYVIIDAESFSKMFSSSANETKKKT